MKSLTGTDTGGSVRVPASYCGILGFRPSHDSVPTTGVILMAQSFDTVGKKWKLTLVKELKEGSSYSNYIYILQTGKQFNNDYPCPGWFARDPKILKQVGHVLLKSPVIDSVRPSQVLIAEDCFKLLSIPTERVAQVLVNSVEKTFEGNLLY